MFRTFDQAGDMGQARREHVIAGRNARHDQLRTRKIDRVFDSLGSLFSLNFSSVILDSNHVLEGALERKGHWHN